VNPNSGSATCWRASRTMPRSWPPSRRVAAERPPMYMVNSDRGITNLHVPSDVIIDASMPALIRAGGKGWGPDGAEADTKCVIPDRCYAGVYDETIRYFKETGALNPATAGTVQNVGLMAQKAEEYGSHPTTFEIPAAGTVKMIASQWRRAARAHGRGRRHLALRLRRKAPIEDWVQLAIDRQAGHRLPAIFWLDATRAHDAELIAMSSRSSKPQGVADKFQILAPARPPAPRWRRSARARTHRHHRQRAARLPDRPVPDPGTGTSAKMLSIVKLMQGGGLFETGAGGSAPKHVQQLQEENHLRWDSLGEFCALGEASSSSPRSRATPRRSAGRRGRRRHPGRPRQRPQPGPQGRPARQPRQPLLVRPLLGRGAGRADRGRSWLPRISRPWPKALAEQEATIWPSCRGARGAGGYRRVLPPGCREAGGGDAAGRRRRRACA
jgi:isocitrate dehydrogenase